jgi:enoyl-CoA hydratase/carnithine racemase
MSKLIDVTVSDGVQVIRFLRADKKNAFTREMYAAMVNALNRADADDETAATVFLGSPGAFSAGNDMADFAARGAGRQIEDTADAMSAARLITTLPLAKKPLIAGVDGLAIGVGVTMLLHCDLVYASPNASFRTPFLNLGLVQEAASSLIGPQRLSYQRAFELLILGETWNADDGYRAGLVNKVVPAADLEETALRAARSLAARPRAALIEARRLMRGDPTPLLEMMKAEGKAFEMLLKSPEAREAFAAFMEKRAPDFAGARRAR